MPVHVTVEGVERVQAYLQKLKDGTSTAGRESVTIGSNLQYAFGIETGRHPTGRLARRAGGAFYLRGGLDTVRPRIESGIAAALPNGGAAVLAAMLKLGHDVQAAAQQMTPVRTGSLRRSIHTVAGHR